MKKTIKADKIVKWNRHEPFEEHSSKQLVLLHLPPETLEAWHQQFEQTV